MKETNTSTNTSLNINVQRSEGRTCNNEAFDESYFYILAGVINSFTPNLYP